MQLKASKMKYTWPYMRYMMLKPTDPEVLIKDLDTEIMYLEIKLKNLHEQRRELINRFNLNKVKK